MKEYIKILELATEGNLPEKIDETSELSADTVRELIDAGHLTAIDASSSDGTAYLKARITLPGREYLNGLKSEEKEEHVEMFETKIRLFISHSSKDSKFVQLLVELLRTALPLPASQVRCTSIDGYRLPGGANTDQQIKQEVHAADTFIGVISLHSIKSLYVVFELGARWGAGRSLIPLIAPGTDSNILSGPLSGINALNAGNRSQILQLISDISTELDVSAESPATYERNIELILKIKTESPENNSSMQEVTDIDQLSEKEIQILKLVSERGDYMLQLNHIANGISEKPTKTEYYIDRLLERELLHDALSMTEPTTYKLTTKGRAFLVENGFI